MSALDPSAPGLPLAGGGGGGASLPTTPALALLDAGNPNVLVGLDADGVGTAEPTSWTPIGSIVRAVGSRVPWEVVRMQLNASVAKTASWDSIRYRVADLP